MHKSLFAGNVRIKAATSRFGIQLCRDKACGVQGYINQGLVCHDRPQLVQCPSHITGSDDIWLARGNVKSAGLPIEVITPAAVGPLLWIAALSQQPRSQLSCLLQILSGTGTTVVLQQTRDEQADTFRIALLRYPQQRAQIDR